MTILCAHFSSSSAGQRAVERITQIRTTPTPFRSYMYRKEDGPIDGDKFPEAATETSRNTVYYTLGGALMFAVIGGVTGATMDLVGLDALTGTGMGALTGAMGGIGCGMMAGARIPKVELRERAEGLETNEVFVLVEVSGTKEQEMIEAELLDAGGYELGEI